MGSLGSSPGGPSAADFDASKITDRVKRWGLTGALRVNRCAGNWVKPARIARGETGSLAGDEQPNSLVSVRSSSPYEARRRAEPVVARELVFRTKPTFRTDPAFHTKPTFRTGPRRRT